MSGEADGALIQVPAKLGLRDADELRERLLEQIDGAGESAMRVEIEGEEPTVPAIQLAAAAAKTLKHASRFAGWGERAGTLLKADEA